MRPKHDTLKWKKAAAKLRELLPLFLLLLVFFGSSVLLSHTIRQTPIKDYGGNWENQGTWWRHDFSRYMGIYPPGEQTHRHKILIIKKESLETINSKPVYTVTAASCSRYTSNFDHWVSKLNFLPLLNWQCRWEKWAMRHADWRYEWENTYYCSSKEVYNHINAGDMVEVVTTDEAISEDFYTIRRSVILEAEDSRPMLYDPDGLIYYLYHKPAE